MIVLLIVWVPVSARLVISLVVFVVVLAVEGICDRAFLVGHGAGGSWGLSGAAFLVGYIRIIMLVLNRLRLLLDKLHVRDKAVVKRLRVLVFILLDVNCVRFSRLSQRIRIMHRLWVLWLRAEKPFQLVLLFLVAVGLLRELEVFGVD